MGKSGFWRVVCIASVFCAAAVNVSLAQTLTTLHSFTGPDGQWPAASLILAHDGNYYGTTSAGGSTGAGTVFKMTPSGALTTLYTFCSKTQCTDGSAPEASLVQATDGNFYGTTSQGGAASFNGTAFRITPSGTLTTLHDFCSQPNCADGAGPLSPMVQGNDGNIYGTTFSAGAGGFGVLYRITLSGAFSVVYSFDAAHGEVPNGPIQGTDGNFYVTAYQGGTNNAGTVVRVTPGGTATVLYNFCSQSGCFDGNLPEAGLLQSTDGNFYGTTLRGGTFTWGVVFKITPSGTLTTLHSFNLSDGAEPTAAVIQATDGNFYGTTYAGGVNNMGAIFAMTPGGTLALLHSFDGTDGTHIQGGLVQASDGSFYGTALAGGSSNCATGCGTVFKLTAHPGSTTSVTDSPNPSMSGELVTMTATVGPPGPPTPTGTVSFTSNGAAISGCTAVLLTSARTAVCTSSTLAVGTDAIVATYSGDSNYLGSSGMLIQIVNPVPLPLQFVPVLPPCRLVDTRSPNGPFGGPALQAKSTRSFTIPNNQDCNIPSSAVAYSLNVTVVPYHTLGYLSVWPTGQGQPVVSTLNSYDGRVKANAAIVPAGVSGAISFYVTDTTELVLDIDGYFIPGGPSTQVFYPLAPCRVADTRNPNGPLGGPFLQGGVNRDFPVLDAAACNIPISAQSYSLNFTVVPHGKLGYLTVCPTPSDPLQNCPVVSTLNANEGKVTANAAIVPAGTGGAIRTFPSNDTDLIIDINGYFGPPGPGGLSLYPVTPCRVLDTRPPSGSGAFQFALTPPVDVLNSPCGPPATSQAYIFNATVVPQGGLGYLTLWPEGLQQPVVSTLNAYDGVVSSNMAIVPAGTAGKVDAWAEPLHPSDPKDLTNLILDISGYFAPPPP